jgi:hypothetical protein
MKPAGQILSAGDHVGQVEETYNAKPNWRLPREIS